jgi:hypothetical protein
MARARAKQNRQQNEIAEAIIAEWFRILPEVPPATPTSVTIDYGSLTAAFNDILDVQCVAIAGEELMGTQEVIRILVPKPPANSQRGLRAYLQNNRDFVSGLSSAALFGCGR